jgi:hypothetical protein
MKGRLGLLICGAVLMAAPVWADRATDSDGLKDSGNGGGSGYAAGGFKLIVWAAWSPTSSITRLRPIM